jgi:hypothetical protein
MIAARATPLKSRSAQLATHAVGEPAPQATGGGSPICRPVVSCSTGSPVHGRWRCSGRPSIPVSLPVCGRQRPWTGSPAERPRPAGRRGHVLRPRGARYRDPRWRALRTAPPYRLLASLGAAIPLSTVVRQARVMVRSLEDASSDTAYTALPPSDVMAMAEAAGISVLSSSPHVATQAVAQAMREMEGEIIEPLGRPQHPQPRPPGSTTARAGTARQQNPDQTGRGSVCWQTTKVSRRRAAPRSGRGARSCPSSGGCT